ncbi:hypothetical protein EYF80_040049 [Liparis tanakae]|uniref:Uncharacterized protein n=1 Tax=Liparis tanakae TaxID=230148 RepID=A0A4Z2G876_9TELE|nr:hypothetical protein EYF80_040049 [Liparis tanakae]
MPQSLNLAADTDLRSPMSHFGRWIVFVLADMSCYRDGYYDFIHSDVTRLERRRHTGLRLDC